MTVSIEDIRQAALRIKPYAHRTPVLTNESLNQQRQMILNEAEGMAHSLLNEILAKRKQVRLYEEKIIPSLRNNYAAYLLAFEQNTEELFMLFDAWETLNMTQAEYLDQLEELLQLQVEFERVMEIK